MSNSTLTCIKDDPEALFLVKDYHLAGLIIFIVGFCGATANYMVVFLIDKVSSLQNAFGRLTLNQAIGEAMHLTVFTFYFAPTVFFDIKFLKSEAVSRIFGHINLVCYDICIYSHLVISLNRLTAIYFPFKYNNIFTEGFIQKIVIFIWLFAILPTFYLYIIEDCRFIYSDAFWNFTFTSSKVCQFITWYTDFLKYVSTVCVIAIIDIITFAKVRFSSSKVNISDAQARRKRHDEINFVKQVCLQGVVFVCELVTYFVLVNYVEGKWQRFFLTTFAWEMVHSCDGYITLLFNKGFFRAIRSSMKTITHSTHSNPSDTYHPKETNTKH
ncbi:unnamed protein product, partial [Mesorhabditis belari]|uniref:G-protein coupled receptors family 1 profile domain-containing protein n=1 Tax=Mesorhabditis belari TaxID=2138241 RepID=A0AAF3FCF0_9BILA